MATRLHATGTRGICKDDAGNVWLRSKVGGTRRLRKLPSKDMATARLALRLWLTELEGEARKVAIPGAKSRDAWGAAVDAWLAEKKGRPDLTTATLHYYEAVAREARTLAPGEALPRSVGVEAARSWWRALTGRMSANFANVCLAAVRSIFKEQRARGLRRDDSTEGLRKVRIGERRLRLPSPEEFAAIAADIGSKGKRDGVECSRMVRWLAYSGLRISEMRGLTWADVEQGRLVVRSAKSRGGADKFRVVPMVPALAELVAEMRAEWAKAKRVPTGPVFGLVSPRGALTAACRRAGVGHLRVHDLRHFFATTCIEAGVDIPTVSRWLGHSDGGALAMRTYGHLRDAHSLKAAGLVRF